MIILTNSNNMSSSQHRKSFTIIDGSTYFGSKAVNKRPNQIIQRDQMVIFHPHGYISSPDFNLGKSLLKQEKKQALDKFLKKTHTKDISHVNEAIRLENKRTKKTHSLENSLGIPNSLETIRVLEMLDINMNRNERRRSSSGSKLNSLPFIGKKNQIHTKLDYETLHQEIQGLALPSNRQGVINLKKWIDAYIENEENLEAVYSAALTECIKQISVHCLDRGNLVHEIIGILKSIWKKQAESKQPMDSDKNLIIKDISSSQLQSANSKLSYKVALLKHENHRLKTDLYSKVEETKFFSESSTQVEISQNDKSTQVIKVLKSNELESVSLNNNENRATLDEHLETLLAKDQVSPEEIENLQVIASGDWNSGFFAGTKLSSKFIEKASVSTSTKKTIRLSLPDQTYSIMYPDRNALTVTHSKVNSIQEELTPQRRSPISSNMKSGSSFKSMAKKILDFQLPRSHKKESYILHLISDFISQPPSKLRKYACLSQKNLIRNIFSFVYSAKTKKKHLETLNSICYFIFEELTLKYSVIDIAERKYKELIASSSEHYNNRKIRLFLRALGGGSLIYEKDMSYEAALLCVNFYQFMSNNLEGNCKQTYTFNKALDCMKEHLEPLISKAEYQEILYRVESLCTENTSKYSKVGYIDIDLFVETTANYYENYRENVLEGIKWLCCDFFGSQILIKKDEFYLVIKNIYPNENINSLKEEIENIHETYSEELTDKPEIFYSSDAIKKICFNKKLFNVHQIHKFVDVEEIGEPSVLNKMVEEINKVERLLDQKETEEVRKALTLTPEVWKEKIKYFYSFVEEANTSSAFLLYRLIKADTSLIESLN